MPKLPSSKLYLGIDPGQSGGFGFIDSSVSVVPMPSTERDIWDRIVHIQSVFGVHQRREVVAVIEKVHSMPKQGVASSFKFGMGYGGLRMALIAARIPFEEIPPQTWMKALGIPSKKESESKAQWKQRLRGKAQQLFPDVPVTLKTCDALLIAEYCRRKHEGKL